MKILCFGSLNIDYTYKVRHFVRKGETLAADSLRRFSGGKGLNQSVAMAKAGAFVWHAGAVGEDGIFLIRQLEAAGVHTEFIQILKDAGTGHAIIQNDTEGDNCILLYGGANRMISEEQMDEALAGFGPGDFLVLQNEINGIPELMEKAHARKMKIVFNPSPMEKEIMKAPLEYVDIFMVNQLEAAQILGVSGTGTEKPEELMKGLKSRFPGSSVVLTLGEQGAMYGDSRSTLFQPAEKVTAVDTTGAGDTFAGYFTAGMAEGLSPEEAMKLAAKASAAAVTRPGASASIPERRELDSMEVFKDSVMKN